jgi:hypothetical protein
MWRMGKGSINREQCSTPEELSVQAKAALTAIPISFVNGMVESSSALLWAVLALSGQCLNGHPDVMRDLKVKPPFISHLGSKHRISGHIPSGLRATDCRQYGIGGLTGHTAAGQFLPLRRFSTGLPNFLSPSLASFHSPRIPRHR